MPAELEDAVRQGIEAAVDREVEHLRGLLDLRLTALVREILAERLPLHNITTPASTASSCPASSSAPLSSAVAQPRTLQSTSQ